MNHFSAALEWKIGTKGFSYKDYDRTHLIKLGSGTNFQASAAPDFLGKPDLVNPEESMVGAVSSCHMLTFLAIASRRGWTLDSYIDSADGVLEKGLSGKLWLSKITLQPKIVWANGVKVDLEILRGLHKEAHDNCFIANSIKSEVVIEI